MSSIDPSESFRPRSALEPHQDRLHRRLAKEHQELADWYLGAAIVLADASNPIRGRVASHVAREIWTKIHGYLKHAGEQGTSKADAAERWAELLQADPSHPVVRAWHGFYSRLMDFPHLKEAGQRPADDNEAVLTFRQFEHLLLRLLSPHYDAIPALDDLLQRPDPTNDDARLLADLLTTPTKRIYFFSRLAHPRWLNLLGRHGFFDHPPACEPDPETGALRCSPWPEGLYLARMAGLAPEPVADIILRLAQRDDSGGKSPRLYSCAVDATLAMPSAFSARIAPHLAKWVRTSVALLAEYKLVDLVTKLSREGEADAAARLLRQLLELKAPSQDAEASEPLSSSQDQAVPIIGDHTFRQLLQEPLMLLSELLGHEALKIAGCCLNAAVRIEERNWKLPHDGSSMWRPAIENHGQNWGQSPKDELVTAVRDVALNICRLSPTETPRVLDWLHHGQRCIFRRIELHLLRDVAQTHRDRVAAALCDRSLFDDYCVYHEYQMLLRNCFSLLEPDEQETILGWLHDGPDLDRYHVTHRERTGEEADEDLVRQWEAHWVLPRLDAIYQDAPDQWKRRYDQIAATYGHLEHPDFRDYHVSWTGPTSPVQKDDLAGMPVPDLLSFLQEWRADQNDHWGPSPEGLGRELEALVREHPKRFAAAAPEFSALCPLYVWHFLTGLREACKAGQGLTWEPVLSLCRQLAAKPGMGGCAEDTSDWTACHIEICKLLLEGLMNGPVQIPLLDSEIVWECIISLVDHPDPVVQAEDGPDAVDASAAYANRDSVRPLALEAAILYAVWWAEHSFSSDEKDAGNLGALSVLPQVRNVLSSRLDMTVERSLAVRSAFGRHFSTLVWLDSAWVAAHVDSIFRCEPVHSRAFQAAWEAYVTSNRFHSDTFALLQRQYLVALSRMDGHLAGPHGPEEALIHHIISLYLLDEEQLGGQFLTELYEHSPGETGTHICWYLWRVAKDTGQDALRWLPRVVDLWAWRIEQAKECLDCEATQKEMEAFGWVFAIDELEEKNSLSLLLETLLLTSGRIDRDGGVVERLGVIAARHPLQCARALCMIVTGTVNHWDFDLVAANARPVLEAALQSGCTEAEGFATDCIQKLGSEGIDDFRDLLGL